MAPAEAEETRDKSSRFRADRPRKTNQGLPPAHLERIEQIDDVEGKAYACRGGTLHQICEDVSERFEVVISKFRVLVQAAATARIVEGGIPTEALIAQALVAMYVDHLSLYRQAQIYARSDMTSNR